MSRALIGLLSTPAGAQHVVVYEDKALTLFLPPYEAAPTLSPLASSLEQWVGAQGVPGAESVRLLPAFPIAVLVFTRIERLANLARPRLEMRGFAPQPWAGLLAILKAQFEGDPSAPKLPAGYAFRPATRIETAPESIAC